MCSGKIPTIFYTLEIEFLGETIKTKKTRNIFQEDKREDEKSRYKEKKEMLGMLRDICKAGNLVFVDESRKALKEYGGYMWTSLKFHNTNQKVQKVLFLAKDLEWKIIGPIRLLIQISF